jgi:16S rRNA A1518/A1519 N6-dimethyltransferase RsmA/KsgA/DIM1 with predicted DNA glycosylase/AP lyase activity
LDARKKFDGRSEDYSRHRPGYPKQILQLLEEKAALDSKSVVADVGSGTGILSGIFLKNGNTVFCVEPNSDMRKKAEELIGHFERCKIIEGSAEYTRLAGSSVDIIVAGQAFH